MQTELRYGVVQKCSVLESGGFFIYLGNVIVVEAYDFCLHLIPVLFTFHIHDIFSRFIYVLQSKIIAAL